MGDAVDVGDIVVLLESMKMEIPVIAEAAGTVTAVKVAEGDVVQEGDPLRRVAGLGIRGRSTRRLLARTTPEGCRSGRSEPP